MASVGVGACTFALARGVSLDAILEATGLTADTLLSPGAWVSQSVLLGMWELLATALPGRLASLEIAEFASPLLLGELGKAARFAPDLGSTMRLISRNSAVLGDGIRIDVLEDAVETEFRMHHPSDAFDTGYGGELGAAVASRVGLAIFGRNLVRRVEFRHRPLAALEVYTDFFRAPVCFGRPHNALFFATADLRTPNPDAEPSLDVLASRWLDRLREEQGIGPVSEAAHRIRAAILANAKLGDYTTAGLARTLGMSLRSLRRQLKAEALDPKTVLEDMRRTYAAALLKDTTLSTDEIAERLGYADERSFRRAFERWTGMSPAQARRAG
jgi:AraC-like DNA-binding protein